jgi:uracil-DNA glycosylase
MGKIDSILEELNSCNDKCESIVNNRVNGIIPRWIGGEIENPALMVVGLNPGKCDTTERFLYKEFVQNDANLIVRFTNHCLLDPGGQKNNYLNKLTELFKDIFGKNNFMKKIYISNVAKCESQINGVVSPETKKHCYEKFLKEEIELLKPKVILALGKEVYQFLKDAGYQNVVKCPHPAPVNVSSQEFWTKSSEERESLIKSIKDKLSI